jgi:GntR family transcriptional regulator
MARAPKWEQIANMLRNEIKMGKLKPGQDFPTNLELMKSFGVHAATIQQAVNALINEGLVISSGSSSTRRTVYKPPTRSIRKCGFLTDAGESGKQEILQLSFLNNTNDIPEDVGKLLNAPVLLYKTRQWRDGIAVAVSESYLPGILPLKNIKKELANPQIELYSLLQKYGFEPKTCSESLVASPPTREDQEALQLPRHTAWPVVRIKRLVWDQDGNLLEYCKLLDRADSYEFVYEFDLHLGG